MLISDWSSDVCSSDLTASNTINVRATVANDKETVWPGQFVNVLITLRVDPNAVVVPNVAVQAGQNGNYLFVVDANSVAHVRPVEGSRTSGNQTLIAKERKSVLRERVCHTCRSRWSPYL